MVTGSARQILVLVSAIRSRLLSNILYCLSSNRSLFLELRCRTASLFPAAQGSEPEEERERQIETSSYSCYCASHCLTLGSQTAVIYLDLAPAGSALPVK